MIVYHLLNIHSIIQRPEPLKQGWFGWIYATFKLTDDTLLQYSGFDGFTFMYYIRTLKKLVIILTLICVSVLLPINIFATYNTGTWPPNPGLNFLTLSTMNYPDQNTDNDLWFWCPSIACWLFSIIVVAQMIHSSNCFLRIREKYRATLERSPSRLESLISKTLLIRVDRVSQGDERIKYLIDHFSKTTCQQIIFGQYNEYTAYLVKEYNETFGKLELAVKKSEQASFSIFRKNKEAERIDRYNHQLASLDKSIRRSLSQLRNANYLFAVYADRQTADQAYSALKIKMRKKHPVIYDVGFAPHPRDIIWQNMHLDNESLRLKRRFGRGLFFSFLFVGMIPIGVIAAFSNLINIFRILRKPLEDYRVILDLMQSYFAPWFMFLFFAASTQLVRWISRQQALKTKSSLEQDTVTKTYALFIIDHLAAFTTFNTMISILGQMSDIRPGLKGLMMSNYVYQIGKNVASSSIYWINYTCINTVSLLFSLLRPLSLLKRKSRLEEFGFGKNYALVLSLFTSTLAYSVTAPIVLPFSLIYFGTAIIVFKYKLAYVYSVRVDTFGRLWPLLYCLTVSSVIVFQLIMIITLRLKGGGIQVYVLIPLPLLTMLTLVYGWILFRRMSVSVGWYTEMEEPRSECIEEIYRDPVLTRPVQKTMDIKEPVQDVPYNPYFETPSTSHVETMEPSAPALFTLLEAERTSIYKE
ncbi:unnamed protein product [Rhizopus stolonifer]